MQLQSISSKKYDLPIEIAKQSFVLTKFIENAKLYENKNDLTYKTNNTDKQIVELIDQLTREYEKQHSIFEELMVYPKCIIADNEPSYFIIGDKRILLNREFSYLYLYLMDSSQNFKTRVASKYDTNVQKDNLLGQLLLFSKQLVVLFDYKWSLETWKNCILSEENVVRLF